MWKRTKIDSSYGLLRKRKLTNGTAARTHARMSAESAALINKRMERVFINKSKKNKEKIVGDCQPGALTNEARPGSLHYLNRVFCGEEALHGEVTSLLFSSVGIEFSPR